MNLIETMSFPISEFPMEVLHHIFSYLNVSDRINASLVCKGWLDVTNCKSLLRDIKVNINNNNTVPVFINMTRNFLNFRFKSIIVDNDYHALFKHCFHDIEWLLFEDCIISKREPIKFDLIYENLKVLTIIDCDLWSLFTCVPNLTELYLSGNSTISDDGIAILQKTMKHLKTLTLGCNVAVDPRAYRRFYPGNSYETCPSSFILSLPAIKSFIFENVCTLKELNLHFIVTGKMLREVSTIKNLCLTKICLFSSCVSSLSDLFKNQPSLKFVNLGVSDLNDDIINALCALLPNVEEISVGNCNFSDKSLSKIFQLKNLKKLEIGRSFSLTPKIVENINSPLNLQSLRLNGIFIKNIDVILKQCKHLLHLDLSNCNVSNDDVHIISENLTRLKYLNLSNTDITDYALIGLEITEQNVRENSKSLSNLKHLKELKLNYCKEITDFGLVKAVHFQYLEYLYVVGCLTEIHTIENLLVQNPSIKKIYCDHELQHPKV